MCHDVSLNWEDACQTAVDNLHVTLACLAASKSHHCNPVWIFGLECTEKNYVTRTGRSPGAGRPIEKSPPNDQRSDSLETLGPQVSTATGRRFELFRGNTSLCQTVVVIKILGYLTEDGENLRLNIDEY